MHLQNNIKELSYGYPVQKATDFCAERFVEQGISFVEDHMPDLIHFIDVCRYQFTQNSYSRNYQVNIPNRWIPHDPLCFTSSECDNFNIEVFGQFFCFSLSL